jgi:hypothetical protein
MIPRTALWTGLMRLAAARPGGVAEATLGPSGEAA